MQRVILLACLFFCQSSLIYAQYWNPIRPGKTQFFIQNPDLDGDSTLHGFRSTFSHVSGPDSIFTFNRIARWAAPDDSVFCMGNMIHNRDGVFFQFLFDKHNVGGDGMIVHHAGDFSFFGPPADTFLLRTNVLTGQKWVYNVPTQDSAWIASRGIENFIGTSDSVIRIQTDSGKRFAISKHYGFIEWDYFYPIYGENVNLNPILYSSGKIWGIEELNFGNHYPQYFDIYNLDPGDQFQYREFMCIPGCSQTNKHKRILSVTPGPNTMTFGGEEIKVRYQFSTPPDTTYTPAYPVNFTPLNEAHFTYLPGERDSLWVTGFGSVKQDWYGRVQVKRFKIEGVICNASGYFEHYQSEAFAEGLGKVMVDEQDVGYINGFELTCYNKVTEIWNGPCDTLTNPIAVDERMDELAGITLYPQPAQNYLRVMAHNISAIEGTWRILNLEGKVLSINPNAQGDEQVFDVRNLPNGIYLLQFKSPDSQWLSKRFSVQR